MADEGPGLEAEQAAHVFDRFYRGNESRTGEGTGLGLSIVAALAAAHGGSARVDTAPGAGSVFVVEIPLADPDDGHGAGTTRCPRPAGDDAVGEPRRRGRRAPCALSFVVDRGRGAPVLFVHGQPGLGSDWDEVAARLTDHRVLIVDRPGYGRSGEETLSIEGNAELLAAMVVERGAVPVTVVGHSYGGGVAIELAARRPDIVAGLVLVGSIGRAESLNILDHLLAVPVMGEVLSVAGLFTLGQVLPRVRHRVGADHRGPLEWLRATLPDERYDSGVLAAWPAGVEELRGRAAHARARDRRRRGRARLGARPHRGRVGDLGPGGAAVGVGQHRGGHSGERARDRGPRRALRPSRRARRWWPRRCAASSLVLRTERAQQSEHDPPT